ncbi:hypothetical protein SK128_013079 [Halocaridina rubra]|uniref:Gamma-tubulin complex component n=1 Tax=Halocaridina rubra TaxID=373956 RepID=A0AAN8XW53_HALRR
MSELQTFPLHVPNPKLSSITSQFPNIPLHQRMRKYFMEAELELLGSTERTESIDREESPEPASNSHEDSQSFEQTISKFELQFSGMIYTLMEKIQELSRENFNDPLVNVIYRLDFNMYFNKKHEYLQIASSPEASVEYMSGPSSG